MIEASFLPGNEKQLSVPISATGSGTSGSGKSSSLTCKNLEDESMLPKIAATSLVLLCLASASSAQSNSPGGTATGQPSPAPTTNQSKSVQGDTGAERNNGQDTGKKTKVDSSKDSGGCNNQANAMSSTSANQEQAGSQSCD